MNTAADGRELPGRLAVDEARQIVLADAQPLPAEQVRLGDAAGRVNAEPVLTPDDSPAFDTSAMDGFAVRSSDDAPRELTVVGDSSAGSPWQGALGGDEAVSISTGAEVPAGADAVVMVEHTEPRPGAVFVPAPVAAGQNVRHRAEIMPAGTQVLAAGTRIGPVETGLLASTGTDPVSCHARPRVAVIATGDELVEAGGSREEGQIWNSNLPVISEMARAAGAEVVLARTAADTPAATEAALAAAFESDLVVICGGVSVGDHDHVKRALDRLGAERRFWGLAMKPGRPAWFGRRGSTRILGLPGNPVSALAVFAILGAPLLRALSGEQAASDPGTGRLATPVQRLSDRLLAVPCRSREAEGRLELEPVAIRGSHDFISLAGTDALALVESGEGAARAGDEVRVVRLPGQ
jgi:molybdopterin molybdotransferase